MLHIYMYFVTPASRRAMNTLGGVRSQSSICRRRKTCGGWFRSLHINHSDRGRDVARPPNCRAERADFAGEKPPSRPFPQFKSS